MRLPLKSLLEKQDNFISRHTICKCSRVGSRVQALTTKEISAGLRDTGFIVLIGLAILFVFKNEYLLVGILLATGVFELLAPIIFLDQLIQKHNIICAFRYALLYPLDVMWAVIGKLKL
jgi:hypothetical protein